MNETLHKILPERFRKVFTKIGWGHQLSSSGNYDIWTNPHDKDVWTIVPKDISSPEYQYYQDKNIRILLYALHLEENQVNISEVKSQLLAYNYKLISRIVSKQEYDQDFVPYEIANLLPSKNISAFRAFYQIKTNGKRSLPIEKFQLSHTERGSFVIPISVIAEPNGEQQDSFDEVPSEMNELIREYLNTIDALLEIKPETEEQYAKEVVGNGIDSKIVKDFLGQWDSVAKYRSKYKDSLELVTLSAKPSLFLDYSLENKLKVFKTVDLSHANPLDNSFIESIERKEIEADTSTLSEKNVKIRAIIDAITRDGRARFRVVGIDNQTFKHPFTAITSELPESKINVCADALKTVDPVVITGDVTKKKHRMGKIFVDNISPGESIVNLFAEKQ